MDLSANIVICKFMKEVIVNLTSGKPPFISFNYDAIMESDIKGTLHELPRKHWNGFISQSYMHVANCKD